jgi:hypothetical protein
MTPIHFHQRNCMQVFRGLFAVLMAILLAACGSGGGDDSPRPCLPTMANPDACMPTMTLSLTDSSGAPTTQVGPGRDGVAQAIVKSHEGVPVPGVVVAFATNDQTGSFIPSAGTALTDATGSAKVTLPASTQGGAFTLTAAANVNGAIVRRSTSYTVTPVPAGSTGALSLSLALLGSTGNMVNQISPDRPGVLQATLRNSVGAPVAGVPVTFTTTDSTGAFVPSSGTALTGSDGRATVQLPAGRQVGAFTASASAKVNDTTVTGSAGYAVTFPTLSLGPISITPQTLSAGGNAGVSVTVFSGSQPYAPPVMVTFTSPCVAAGRATLGPPVQTQSGVAAVSYTDKGCGVADQITASVAFADVVVTQTGVINVLAANVGAIKFLTADTTNIALKGTGGFGRQEVSTVSFQVFDSTGNPVSGKIVDFLFSDSNSVQTIGGLTLQPSFATSDANGRVTTLVTAGTIPTSVRILATVRGTTPAITTLSNILVISTGIPDQRHLSLASTIGNCEGWNIDQTCSFITATLGDHFGNPVPDGTAVNFSTESGIIDASCVTGSLPPPGLSTPPGQTTGMKVGPGSGTCTVTLRSSGTRPAGSQATVLAYALGEEDFFDANGNNSCDGCDIATGTTEFSSLHDKSPDVHRDDNENGKWDPGEPCVGPNLNGTCSTPGDGRYNGVLRMPRVPSPQSTYVSAQIVQTLSASAAIITFNPGTISCALGEAVDVAIKVTDINRKIMPAGTTITFEALTGGIGGLELSPGAGYSVNNVVLAVGGIPPEPIYMLSVGCTVRGPSRLIVKAKTPSGFETLATANIVVN